MIYEQVVYKFTYFLVCIDCIIIFYSEWKPESEHKLIDNVLRFTQTHMKYIEKTLVITTNMLEKYGSFYAEVLNN